MAFSAETSVNLEEHFREFREHTIGFDAEFETAYGTQKMLYADWIASGRLYGPIEKQLAEAFGPFVGNTHTETSVTGTTMTAAYHYAHHLLKRHVNAAPDDLIITAGSGMTGVINKFQRILGLRIPEQVHHFIKLCKEMKPVVFLTHMEHHSNQTSWLETIADVVVIDPDEYGLVDLKRLEHELEQYKHRYLKIGSFTACSNVTGIETPVHDMAELMHKYDGLCFIDYACSAPYVQIDMHPPEPGRHLDAVFFSPHKFLGGPGTSGVLIFNSKLYTNKIPDNPGGGTVDWTNPWGEHKFTDNIEAREDGGTPPFLQAIRAALAVKLKERMNPELMRAQEEKLVELAMSELEKIDGIHILAGHVRERLGAISFYVENIHYNLLVQVMNDMYGIQVRGGCSCAGTYGHYLLHVDPARSRAITESINSGDLSQKPGWVRLSLHPAMTEDDVLYIASAVSHICKNIDGIAEDYIYHREKNEFVHRNHKGEMKTKLEEWFEL